MQTELEFGSAPPADHQRHESGVAPRPSDHESRAAVDASVPPAEGRSALVWRQWLSSMASDAEAALAAAIAYREMEPEGREQWLSSLAVDGPAAGVPLVALYAPLLAVEEEPERRARLIAALGDVADWAPPSEHKRALVGQAAGQIRVFVLATPLYLDFVQVLACGVQDGRFSWVRHDPIVKGVGVPVPGDLLEGATLEASPVKSVLDDLAATVLSHRRSGASFPEALKVLGDLLGPLGP